MSGGVIYGSEAEVGKKNTGNGAAIYKNGGTVDPAELLTGNKRDVTTLL
ncbi:MAG: hypothetical protein LBL76_00405 [Treponema sp.]|jgi:hypothetical protein|nr:hypothetical protein [Treponema sp.]